eukprot:CAMPEP_0202460424 /NCGR_PEP_ID=MMETSP1360-20130828/43894_1 /ASSEMBLY_ACC=CAM_ASM_000848 /TAXON_ID=515479 /ORGANISM="Licmophora paradoxa, Strain CCMP2313" /LENGTH=118 /DNA_ID=CAMNT_0049082079 /DNA_START=122 /DNA_END=478 /DNA_ORIENTATION=-
MEEVAETANLIQRCLSWLPFGICGATKTGDDQKKINPEHQARFVLEPSALVAESNDEFLQVVEAHLDEFMANDPDSQTRSVITMTEAAQIVAEAFDGDNEEEEKEEEAPVCRSLEKRY